MPAMIRSSAVAVLSITLALTLPLPAYAQGGVSVLYVAADDHRLLGDALTGLTGRLLVPFGDRWSFRARAERAWGEAHRIGIACAGLILPGTCSSEPIVDNSRLTTVAAGLGLRLFRWQGLVAELAGNLGFAWVKADSHGQTSGRSLSADKSLWLREVGVDLSWSPFARLPLALEAGVTTGRYAPREKFEIIDGYTPFEDAFRVDRIRIGVAWRPASR